jgi:hypothetical protein
MVIYHAPHVMTNVAYLAMVLTYSRNFALKIFPCIQCFQQFTVETYGRRMITCSGHCMHQGDLSECIKRAWVRYNAIMTLLHKRVILFS